MVRTSLKCYIILLPLGKLNRRENVFSIWSEKYFKYFICWVKFYKSYSPWNFESCMGNTWGRKQLKLEFNTTWMPILFTKLNWKCKSNFWTAPPATTSQPGTSWVLTSTLITPQPQLSSPLLLYNLEQQFSAMSGLWCRCGGGLVLDSVLMAHQTNYNVEISIMVSIYINIQYIVHHAKLVHQSNQSY